MRGGLMTEALLLVGVATAVVFVGVLVIEGALRPGYDPVYHTGSELELGQRGWVQRANFFQMSIGGIAFAAGIYRALGTGLGALLLAIFGAGLIVPGVYVPDAVRGYPPGAPTSRRGEFTWQHRVHHMSAPIMLLSLFGACLTIAVSLRGAWRAYTVLTAVVGLALTVGTALAYERDAAKTGLVQRGLVLVYWSWIVSMGVHLSVSGGAA